MRPTPTKHHQNPTVLWTLPSRSRPSGPPRKPPIFAFRSLSLPRHPLPSPSFDYANHGPKYRMRMQTCSRMVCWDPGAYVGEHMDRQDVREMHCTRRPSAHDLAQFVEDDGCPASVDQDSHRPDAIVEILAVASLAIALVQREETISRGGENGAESAFTIRRDGVLADKPG